MASLVARSAPHDQTIVVRLNGRQVARVTGVITRQGDSEPAAGFSRDFPEAPPGRVRHTFSAPNDTYIVVITLTERGPNTGSNTGTTAQSGPIPSETSFERRVSLAGGEVIVSPD